MRAWLTLLFAILFAATPALAQPPQRPSPVRAVVTPPAT
jgi:hypothetical protein